MNADVNALNAVTEEATAVAGGAAKSGKPAGVSRPGIVAGEAGNNIGGSQLQSAGARIVGDDNTISSLVSVNPQVNAGVNILNTITQTVSGATGSGGAEKGGGLLGGVLGGLGGGANNIGGRQVSKCSKL